MKLILQNMTRETASKNIVKNKQSILQKAPFENYEHCYGKLSFEKHKVVSQRTKFSVNSATDLGVYSSQIRISAFGFTRTVGGDMMMSHTGSGDSRRGSLDHTRAHVAGCRRTDTASQAAQIQVAGGQIRGQVTATVVGGVE